MDVELSSSSSSSSSSSAAMLGNENDGIIKSSGSYRNFDDDANAFGPSSSSSSFSSSSSSSTMMMHDEEGSFNAPSSSSSFSSSSSALMGTENDMVIKSTGNYGNFGGAGAAASMFEDELGPAPVAAAVVDNRPLSERIVDKNWNTRKISYDDLKKQCLSNAGGDADFYREMSQFLTKIVSDSNPNALDVGLDAALTLVDTAPSADIIKQYYESITSHVVDKGFAGGRASTVSKGKALILKMIEVDEPSACVAVLLTKLADKKPKIPPTCLEIIKEGISLFGAKCFNVKDILKSLEPILNGTNAPARELALSLMVDLSRWIGKAPFNTVFYNNEKIRKAQITEFDRLLAENEAKNLGVPLPSLYLRKERPSAAAIESMQVDNLSSAGGSSAFASMDSREYIEDIDLTKRMKGTDFVTLTADESKWGEQVSGLQKVVDILGPTPKIKPGCLDTIAEIVQVCRGFLRSQGAHIQCQVLSLKIITLFCDGARAEFSPLFRSLIQLIFTKTKEKRTTNEVSTCLMAGLQFSCSSTDSFLEEITECIKNKKNPPHARNCAFEFISGAISKCPDKVSQDSIKPFTEACLSSCEDPDVKVRDAAVSTIVSIAKLIKSRGKSAADSSRILSTLEQSNPKLFKRIQTESINGPKPTVTTTNSSSSSSSSSNNNSSSLSSSSNNVMDMKKPHLASSSAVPVKKPLASGGDSKVGGGSSSQAPSKSAATASAKDDEVDVEELALGIEDAKLTLAELEIEGWDAAFQQAMTSIKWQDKVEAFTVLGNAIAEKNVDGRFAAPVVVYMAAMTANFKISNMNVLVSVIKAASQVAESCASSSSKFSKPAAWELIKFVSDKLSEKRTSELVSSMLTALCKSITPQFVAKRMMVATEKLKSPAAHESFMQWLKASIKDEFGAGSYNVPSIVAFCKVEVENKDVKVRTAAIELLGQLYNQIGPRLESIVYSDDIKPQLKALIDAEFKKVGYDPAAAASKMKQSSASGGSSSSSSNSIGIPRQDLASLLDKNILAELNNIEGKSSWQNRKSALEAILQVCDRSKYYLDISKSSVEILKALKPRINDTQANLKPLAVQAIGSIIASSDEETASKAFRVMIPSLITGLADNKKNMRDCTLSAIQMAVTLNKSPFLPAGVDITYPLAECSTGLSSLLAALPSVAAESLINTVGRLELLSFMLSHVDNFKCDCSEVVNALITCMQDKMAVVRVAAEQLLAGFVSRSSVTRQSIDKATRDLPPQTKRTLQPSVDRMMALYGAKKTSGSAPISSSSNDQTAMAIDISSLSSASSVPTSAPYLASSAAMLSMPVASSATSSDAMMLGGGGHSEESNLALKKTNKVKRVEEFYKINWPQPPEDIGQHEISALKVTWDPFISSSLSAMLFIDVGKGQLSNQDIYVPAINELSNLLDSPNLIQHSDLILRWCAYVLCQRETLNGLQALLQFLHGLFDTLKSKNCALHDSEISSIIPHLIERCGHKSERHKSLFRSALSAANDVISAGKYGQALIQGLNSKNRKSRVICLEVLQQLVDTFGFEKVISKSGLKEIGSFLDKDNDNSGRQACLDLCSSIYLCMGGDVAKLLKCFGSDLSDRAVSMVQDRMKLNKQAKTFNNGNGFSVLASSSVSMPVSQDMSLPPQSSNAVIQSNPIMKHTPIAAVVAVGGSGGAGAASVAGSFNFGGYNISSFDDEGPFKLEITPPPASISVRKRKSPDNPSVDLDCGAAYAALSGTPMAGSKAGGELSSKKSTKLTSNSTASPVNFGVSYSPLSSYMPSSAIMYADIYSKVESYIHAVNKAGRFDDSCLHYVEVLDRLKIYHELVRGTFPSDSSSLQASSLTMIPLLCNELMKACFTYPCTKQGTSRFNDFAHETSLLTVTVSILYRFVQKKNAIVDSWPGYVYDAIVLSCVPKIVELETLISSITTSADDLTFVIVGNSSNSSNSSSTESCKSLLVAISQTLNMILAGLCDSSSRKDLIIITLTKLFIAQFNTSSSSSASSNLVGGSDNVSIVAARFCEYVLSSERSVELPYNNWDITSVLSTLNEYFIHISTFITSSKGEISDENPMRCAKTVLSEMIMQVGQKTLMTKCSSDLGLSKDSILCNMILLLSSSSSNAVTKPSVCAFDSSSSDDKVFPAKATDSFLANNYVRNENISENLIRSSSSGNSNGVMMSPNALKRSAIQDKVKGSLQNLTMTLSRDLDALVPTSVSSSMEGGVSMANTGAATDGDLFARFNRIFNRTNNL